jgi:predicted nuclease of predicted toxin-antitoxin system
MPLAYLLDENLRGLLWRRIQRHNARGFYPIDVTRVGDSPNLPLSATDPEILIWAEREDRIIVSRDERTLAKHLAEHVGSGNNSPGIFLARAVPLETLVDFLVCAAHASEAREWADQVTFIP